MKLLTSAKWAVIGLLIAVLAATAVPAFSAPEQQNNLLANPDFEGNFSTEAYKNVPDGWTAWAQDNDTFDAPRWNASEGSGGKIKSGARSLSVWINYRRFNGGVWQKVNATPGTNYHFTAWGEGISVPDANSNIQFQIGIDPNGGTDPFAAGVAWSGIIIPMGNYQQLSVDAVAKAAQITVFLRASNDWPIDQSEAYWDATSLTATGAAAPTNTSAPSGGTTGGSTGGGNKGSCNSNSVPVGSIPEATPQPDGSIIHTVAKCETLTGIAVTYGLSLEQIRQMNSLKSDIIIPGQQLLVREAQQPTAVPPTATSEVQATDNPTQVAEATNPSAETQPQGTICLMGYEDSNNNGIREPEEPKQAGLTFAVSDGTSTIGTYTTDGLSEPYCFSGLKAGNYTVSWVADNYTPTTDQTWIANLSSGSTVNHEFGVSSGEDTANNSDQGDTGGSNRLVIALVAAVGTILLLGGLGAGGYFLMMRRSSQI